MEVAGGIDPHSPYGAAVIFQVESIIAITTTSMQSWLCCNYFGRNSNWINWDGKRDDMFPKGNWKAELEALEAAIEKGTQQP